LRTIVYGIEADAGRGLKVAAGSDPQPIDSKYQSNPVLGVFGNLDLGFIVRIVLSLLAILFTYDSITGEKEKGTLRLVLSNRLPKDKLIVGKAIGGFLCLLVALFIPFILSLVILMAYPNISLAGDDWARIALIFLLFLLYISVFFMLGFFISARTHRSATSFLVLLFIWVTFVTIIPKVSVMVAAQLRPIPSANEIALKKDQFLQGLYKETMIKLDAWIKANPRPEKREDRVSWADKITKYSIDLAQERQQKYEEYTATVDRDYQLKKRSQDQLAADLSRISPTGSLTFASMSLARTGLDEYRNFLNSVRLYWPIWYKWTFSKTQGGPPPAIGSPPLKLDLSDMPQFRYLPERINSSIRPALIDFGIMGIMIILFFAGAYWSFVRYDVR